MINQSPVIGIIICGSQNHRQFVSEDYIAAIVNAGGIPVILPCTILPAKCNSLSQNSCSYIPFSLHSMLCDSFLFCGGCDVSPILFNEDSMTSLGETDLRIDLFHINLMKHLLSLNRPILAICRGMQVLNVACGGTIYQDLSLRKTETLNHMQPSKERSDVCHKIQLLPDSIIGDIYHSTYANSPSYVNSFHHQCIHSLGNDLKITAMASDGVIEAIESTVHPFVLGVQWHPECMCHSDYASKKLFTKFVNASSA